jgi:large subunit ribosomal protein L21
MKYKNKVRYRRILGHRQPVTRLVVQSITKG